MNSLSGKFRFVGTGGKFTHTNKPNFTLLYPRGAGARRGLVMQRNRKHLHIGLFFILLLLLIACVGLSMLSPREINALASALVPAGGAAEEQGRLYLPAINLGGLRESWCLNREVPAIVLINGPQKNPYRSKSSPLPEDAIVDARSAVWKHVHDYPVVVEGGPDICFTGGRVYGDYLYSASWERMHDTTGFTFRTSGMTTVENVHIHNYGDGISFSRGGSGESFTISGAWMTHIRDDCIQNDYMYAGLVEDSLLDGCYTAFSAQPHKGAEVSDGSSNVWEIRRSLIRLEPMEKVYNDQGLIPGHGPFFKWSSDGISPKLALHDNIFRVDQPSNSSNGLGIPDGKLASCSNNVVVWLGEGEFPDPLPKTFGGLPCFTVTTDPTVWDSAVQQWKLHHPEMQE